MIFEIALCIDRKSQGHKKNCCVRWLCLDLLVMQKILRDNALIKLFHLKEERLISDDEIKNAEDRGKIAELVTFSRMAGARQRAEKTRDSSSGGGKQKAKAPRHGPGAFV